MTGLTVASSQRLLLLHWAGGRRHEQGSWYWQCRLL